MAYQLSKEEWDILAKCCGVEVSHGDKEVHITVPCLDSPSDFINTGLPHIISIHTTLKRVMFIATHAIPKTGADQFNGKDVCWAELNLLTEERYNFLGSATTKVNKSYYDLLSQAPCKNLKWTIRIGKIGNSSYNIIVELNSLTGNEIYITNTYQYVTVDKITRQADTLPEWWKTRYSSYQDSTVDKLHIKPFSKPYKDVSMVSCTVNWSHVDHYRHAGFISYITFCFELIRDVPYSCAHMKVKNVSLLYMKELLVKDNIYVYGWKHSEDDHEEVYRFSIKTSSSYMRSYVLGDLSDTIFQSEMSFYK